MKRIYSIKCKHMKEKKIRTYLNNSKIILLFIVLLTSFVLTKTQARYLETISGEKSVGTAAVFGKLKLTETTSSDGETVENDKDEKNEETYTVITNTDFEKHVDITYTQADVTTYVFFVVENTSWTYDEETKIISIRGEDNYVNLLYWTMNDNWTFLKEEQSGDTKKFIFYHEVAIGETFTDTIIDKITVNPISVRDKRKLNSDNNSIEFSAYAIEKNGTKSVENAWEKAKGEK